MSDAITIFTNAKIGIVSYLITSDRTDYQINFYFDYNPSNLGVYQVLSDGTITKLNTTQYTISDYTVNSMLGKIDVADYNWGILKLVDETVKSAGGKLFIVRDVQPSKKYDYNVRNLSYGALNQEFQRIYALINDIAGREKYEIRYPEETIWNFLTNIESYDSAFSLLPTDRSSFVESFLTFDENKKIKLQNASDVLSAAIDTARGLAYDSEIKKIYVDVDDETITYDDKSGELISGIWQLTKGDNPQIRNNKTYEGFGFDIGENGQFQIGGGTKGEFTQTFKKDKLIFQSLTNEGLPYTLTTTLENKLLDSDITIGEFSIKAERGTQTSPTGGAYSIFTVGVYGRPRMDFSDGETQEIAYLSDLGGGGIWTREALPDGTGEITPINARDSLIITNADPANNTKSRFNISCENRIIGSYEKSDFDGYASIDFPGLNNQDLILAIVDATAGVGATKSARLRISAENRPTLTFYGGTTPIEQGLAYLSDLQWKTESLGEGKPTGLTPTASPSEVQGAIFRSNEGNTLDYTLYAGTAIKNDSFYSDGKQATTTMLIFANAEAGRLYSTFGLEWKNEEGTETRQTALILNSDSRPTVTWPGMLGQAKQIAVLDDLGAGGVWSRVDGNTVTIIRDETKPTSDMVVELSYGDWNDADAPARKTLYGSANALSQYKSNGTVPEYETNLVLASEAPYLKSERIDVGAYIKLEVKAGEQRPAVYYKQTQDGQEYLKQLAYTDDILWAFVQPSKSYEPYVYLTEPRNSSFGLYVAPTSASDGYATYVGENKIILNKLTRSSDFGDIELGRTTITRSLVGDSQNASEVLTIDLLSKDSNGSSLSAFSLKLASNNIRPSVNRDNGAFEELALLSDLGAGGVWSRVDGNTVTIIRDETKPTSDMVVELSYGDWNDANSAARKMQISSETIATSRKNAGSNDVVARSYLFLNLPEPCWQTMDTITGNSETLILPPNSGRAFLATMLNNVDKTEKLAFVSEIPDLTEINSALKNLYLPYQGGNTGFYYYDDSSVFLSVYNNDPDNKQLVQQMRLGDMNIDGQIWRPRISVGDQEDPTVPYKELAFLEDIPAGYWTLNPSTAPNQARILLNPGNSGDYSFGLTRQLSDTTAQALKIDGNELVFNYVDATTPTAPIMYQNDLTSGDQSGRFVITAAKTTGDGSTNSGMTSLRFDGTGADRPLLRRMSNRIVTEEGYLALRDDLLWEADGTVISSVNGFNGILLRPSQSEYDFLNFRLINSDILISAANEGSKGAVRSEFTLPKYVEGGNDRPTWDSGTGTAKTLAYYDDIQEVVSQAIVPTEIHGGYGISATKSGNVHAINLDMDKTQFTVSPKQYASGTQNCLAVTMDVTETTYIRLEAPITTTIEGLDAVRNDVKWTYGNRTDQTTQYALLQNVYPDGILSWQAAELSAPQRIVRKTFAVFKENNGVYYCVRESTSNMASGMLYGINGVDLFRCSDVGDFTYGKLLPEDNKVGFNQYEYGFRAFTGGIYWNDAAKTSLSPVVATIGMYSTSQQSAFIGANYKPVVNSSSHVTQYLEGGILLKFASDASNTYLDTRATITGIQQNCRLFCVANAGIIEEDDGTKGFVGIFGGCSIDSEVMKARLWKADITTKQYPFIRDTTTSTRQLVDNPNFEAAQFTEIGTANGIAARSGTFINKIVNNNMYWALCLSPQVRDNTGEEFNDWIYVSSDGGLTWNILDETPTSDWPITIELDGTELIISAISGVVKSIDLASRDAGLIEYATIKTAPTPGAVCRHIYVGDLFDIFPYDQARNTSGTGAYYVTYKTKELKLISGGGGSGNAIVGSGNLSLEGRTLSYTIELSVPNGDDQAVLEKFYPNLKLTSVMDGRENTEEHRIITDDNIAWNPKTYIVPMLGIGGWSSTSGQPPYTTTLQIYDDGYWARLYAKNPNYIGVVNILNTGQSWLAPADFSQLTSLRLDVGSNGDTIIQAEKNTSAALQLTFMLIEYYNSIFKDIE